MLHSFIPASIFFALIVLAGGAIVTVVQALKAGARREEASIVQEPVAASRFTIPVSILLPVDSNQDALPQTVRMLLGLAYPEFEVIVVAGRLEGDVLDRLSTEWGLAAKEFFYRHSIETEPVNRIYRAGVDSRLTVVDKAGAGRADALNCGVDLARYRYVCTIPDDVEVETDGLLRVMSPALWDPAQVLAVSSHIERAPSGRYRSPTADASEENGLRKRTAFELVPRAFRLHRLKLYFPERHVGYLEAAVLQALRAELAALKAAAAIEQRPLAVEPLRLTITPPAA